MFESSVQFFQLQSLSFSGKILERQKAAIKLVYFGERAELYARKSWRNDKVYPFNGENSHAMEQLNNDAIEQYILKKEYSVLKIQ